MKTYWLNFHLGYCCRHSLACCSSGWPIPMERDRAASVEREIAAGRVHPLQTPWLMPTVDPPDEVAGALAFAPAGTCVFLKADRRQPMAEGCCSIHSLRPLSCAHFPYVCLIDRRGVHVTLSHYCPTAASLLFDHDGPVEVVEGPSPVPELEIPEGLDARESLPPLASPSRLMSFDEFAQWERDQVSAYAADGRFHLRQGYGGLVGETSPDLFSTARRAVPSPLSWPAAPDSIDRVWAELVEPAWESFAPVISRYLAAKLFASWAAYLGDGVHAIQLEVEIAAAVLRVEAVRQCERQSRMLDAGILKEAIRQSDLLLVHLADREKLSQSRPI